MSMDQKTRIELGYLGLGTRHTVRQICPRSRNSDTCFSSARIVIVLFNQTIKGSNECFIIKIYQYSTSTVLLIFPFSVKTPLASGTRLNSLARVKYTGG